MKKIIVINEYKYSLKRIFKNIKEIKIESIEKLDEINNISEDILVINIDIKNIEYLKTINKKINPDIIFIPKIEDIYTKSIEEKEYNFIKKALKKLKNKTLIINSNDKYLKKFFSNKLDIYRYGNSIYDDIEYIKYKKDIIIIYQGKKYILKNKDEDIIGNIIIGLLFGIEIEKLIEKVEKTT